MMISSGMRHQKVAREGMKVQLDNKGANLQVSKFVFKIQKSYRLKPDMIGFFNRQVPRQGAAIRVCWTEHIFTDTNFREMNIGTLLFAHSQMI